MNATPWERWELDMLVAQYPHMVTKAVAIFIGRPVANIYAKAYQLGLHKTPEFFAAPASGRTNVVTRGGATRFRKGHPSWNKGTKGWSAGGRSIETQFKPGVRQGVAVKLYKPIGTERVSKDGYLERKVNDGLPLQRRWKAVHRILWVQAHGPVPPGYCIAFKPGSDKAKPRLEDLELRSLVENMRRNTLHNYPKEIAHAIQLRAALNRRINRATRTP